MRRKWLIWAAVGVVVLLILTVRVKVQGPYLGKVVDKEIGRPIEGAAVVAVWLRSGAGLVQRVTFFQEAQETVTDQQGHFTIPGTWGVQVTLLVELREPAFTIFKPRHKVFGGWTLNPITAPVREKGRVVIQLQQLKTQEERLRNLSDVSLSPFVPKAKYPNLRRLESVERVDLALKP